MIISVILEEEETWLFSVLMIRKRKTCWWSRQSRSSQPGYVQWNSILNNILFLNDIAIYQSKCNFGILTCRIFSEYWTVLDLQADTLKKGSTDWSGLLLTLSSHLIILIGIRYTSVLYFFVIHFILQSHQYYLTNVVKQIISILRIRNSTEAEKSQTGSTFSYAVFFSGNNKR